MRVVEDREVGVHDDDPALGESCCGMRLESADDAGGDAALGAEVEVGNVQGRAAHRVGAPAGTNARHRRGGGGRRFRDVQPVYFALIEARAARLGVLLQTLQVLLHVLRVLPVYMIVVLASIPLT